MTEPAKEELVWVPLDKMHPSSDKVRIALDSATIDAIAATIPKFGIREPIVLRLRKDGEYDIEEGEHRYYAGRKAGLKGAWCKLSELNDDDAYVASLIENVCRHDLNAIDEAAAYLQLKDKRHMTEAAIAKLTPYGVTYVSNRIRLLSLPDSVVDAISGDLLDASKGLLLLQLPKDRQAEVGRMAIEHNMSYQGLENVVSDIKLGMAQAGQPAGREEPGKDATRPMRKCYWCGQDRDANTFVVMQPCSECAKHFPPKMGS